MDTTYLEIPTKGLANDIASIKLEDGYASIMQDWVVYPDRVQARGTFGNSAEFTQVGTGVVDGVIQHQSGRILVIYRGKGMSVWENSSLTGSPIGTIDLAAEQFPRADPYYYLWSSVNVPPTNGGSINGLDNPIVDFSETYFTIGDQPAATTTAVAGVPATWVWGGAYTTRISVGTATATRDSTAVTGSGTSWSTYAASMLGAYFYILDTVTGDYAYAGRIKSVNSNTSITLSHRSWAAGAGAVYSIVSTRRPHWSESTGVITTSTSSATVTGSGTLFSEVSTDDFATFNGVVIRLSDMRYVGRISSITNNTSLTLVDPATVEMNSEPYAIVRLGVGAQLMSASYVSKSNDGAAVEQYAGRTWYGNTGGGGGKRKYQFINQLAIAVSPANGWPDSMEFSIALPSSGPSDAIQQLTALDEQLIVHTTYATWAITGRSLGSFETHRIYNDGALRPRAVCLVNDGVAWAGKRGIYMYTPGQGIVNLMAPYNLRAYRTWVGSITSSDQVYLNTFDKYIVATTGNATTVNAQPYVIDYVQGAVLKWSNCSIRGSIISSTGKEILVGSRTAGILATDVDTFIADNVAYGTIDAGLAFGSSTKGPVLSLQSQAYEFDLFDIQKELKEIILNADVYYDSDPQLSLNAIITLPDVTYNKATFDKLNRIHRFLVNVRAGTFSWAIVSDAVNADSTRTLMKLYDVGIKARLLRQEAVRKNAAV